MHLVDLIKEIEEFRDNLILNNYHYAFIPENRSKLETICKLIDFTCVIKKNRINIDQGRSHIHISRNELNEFDLHLIFFSREINVVCVRKLNLDTGNYLIIMQLLLLLKK